MAYDTTKDKEIYKEVIELDKQRLIVAIYSYNDGPSKLQISREYLDPKTNNYSFAKLGRLSKDELSKILPIIQKCLERM